MSFRAHRDYSLQNLGYMRQMCLEYKDNAKLRLRVGEISGSHHLAHTADGGFAAAQTYSQ